MTRVLTLRMPDDQYAKLGARAKETGVSREAFVRNLIANDHSNSASAAIARRATLLVDEITSMPKDSPLQISRAALARQLGYPDVTVLESRLRGDTPLAFREIDALCALVGASNEWMQDGECSRYSHRRLYSDPWELLRAIASHDFPYTAVWFVLPDNDESLAFVVGQKTALQYDVLLSNIPIREKVGGGGTGAIINFAELLVALDLVRGAGIDPLPQKGDNHIRYRGQVIDDDDHRVFQSGESHIATFLRKAYPSNWYSAFADLSKDEQPYVTKGFAAAQKILRGNLDYQYNVRSNTEFRTYVERLYALNVGPVHVLT